MRTRRTLLGLAVAGTLLAGCGERTSDDAPSSSGTLSDAPASSATPTTPPPTPSPTPSPTPEPTATATATATAEATSPARTIPEGLAVDGGMPEGGGDFQRHGHGVGLELCGAETFPVGDLADRRTAWVSGPEYAEGRDLRLFRDAEAAEAFVAGVGDRVRACPRHEDHGSVSHHVLVRSTLRGDESFTAVQTYSHRGRPSLGASFWEVVRVGRAVLLTASYGEYDPQHNLDQGIRDHAADVAHLVDALRTLGRH